MFRPRHPATCTSKKDAFVRDLLQKAATWRCEKQAFSCEASFENCKLKLCKTKLFSALLSSSQLFSALPSSRSMEVSLLSFLWTLYPRHFSSLQYHYISSFHTKYLYNIHIIIIIIIIIIVMIIIVGITIIVIIIITVIINIIIIIIIIITIMFIIIFFLLLLLSSLSLLLLYIYIWGKICRIEHWAPPCPRSLTSHDAHFLQQCKTRFALGAVGAPVAFQTSPRWTAPLGQDGLL